MTALALLAALVCVAGLVQAMYGAGLVANFVGRPPATPRQPHPITVLKPLHGDEPLLEEALATLCQQDYSAFQIVCGVQDPADPAIRIVERLRERFPSVDIALVVDPTPHGSNRKVANLINMLPSAKHNILAIADSDLHVRPGYLADLVATLERPNVGLATVLYTGLPATPSMPRLLGATSITHGFLPGATMARAMGRQDCLGATMCLRRETLERIGGLPALADHLADDNVLGQLVRRLGLRVELADTIVATTVPENSLGALFRHELRWARTIKALEPVGFALSALQYPLFWAAAAVLLSGLAAWSIAMFLGTWAIRALAATWIDWALRGKLESLASPAPIVLLPLRDILSVVTMLASHAGKQVDWRGHTMQATGFSASEGPSRR